MQPAYMLFRPHPRKLDLTLAGALALSLLSCVGRRIRSLDSTLLRLTPISAVSPSRPRATPLVGFRPALHYSKSLDSMRRRPRCNCPANIGVFGPGPVVRWLGSAPTPFLSAKTACKYSFCSGNNLLRCAGISLLETYLFHHHCRLKSQGATLSSRSPSRSTSKDCTISRACANGSLVSQ